MTDSLDFVFLQCLLAAAGLIFLIIRCQTAFMGITCLFAFNVASASLSAFFFGRVFGLREQWITADHERVFVYSGWACLAIVAALWLAWLSSKGKRRAAHHSTTELFPWVTEQFVFFALMLGAISTIAQPFVHPIPTIGTAVILLASWLKLGLISAVILFKKNGNFRPLLVAILLYIPAGAIYALRTGHTPLSMDAIVPIALVATCLSRVTLLSFVKLFLWILPCVYLMFGWMASRGVIRSGELEKFPMMERAVRFGGVFADEITHVQLNAYSVQGLLLERIDMSDTLAQQSAFQNSATGEDEFVWGDTIWDGLYAVVPRALWSDKPLVAGYADFVGRFTGADIRTDSTSIGVPIQFELFANGGPTVVVIGVFILFYLCGRLEHFLAYTRRSLHVLMPCMMFLMAFANGIERITVVLAGALAGAISAFVLARIVEVAFPQFLPQLGPVRVRPQLRPAWPATA